MTSLIRPSVFDEMVSLRDAVNNLYENSFISPTLGRPNAMATPLNVYEDNSNYYVVGLLPGLEPDKLDLSVKENVLTISGEYNFNDWPQVTLVEKTTSKSNGNSNSHGQQASGSSFRTLLNELPTGKFFRQLALPGAFDFEGIAANYENGLLKLTLPKAERSQTKRISLTPGKQISTING